MDASHKKQRQRVRETSACILNYTSNEFEPHNFHHMHHSRYITYFQFNFEVTISQSLNMDRNAIQNHPLFLMRSLFGVEHIYLNFESVIFQKQTCSKFSWGQEYFSDWDGIVQTVFVSFLSLCHFASFLGNHVFMWNVV